MPPPDGSGIILDADDPMHPTRVSSGRVFARSVNRGYELPWQLYDRQSASR